MMDAVMLGAALRTEPDVERALHSYEQERRPKTTALLAQGRRTARFMRTMNPVACYARELALRAIPVTPLIKLVGRINRRAGTDVSRTGPS
jgi:2-polyprenyl-6-methoxyphenol hydroxylase-like FAD-dependent oxidoreductase